MDNQNKLIKLVGQRINGDTHTYIKKETEKKKKIDKNEEKQMLETEKEYKEALAYIKDAIAPAYWKSFPNKLKINNTFVKTFFVYAYPNFLE